MVTWSAATGSLFPTTKGGREERPWERGWRQNIVIRGLRFAHNIVVTRLSLDPSYHFPHERYRDSRLPFGWKLQWYIVRCFQIYNRNSNNCLTMNRDSICRYKKSGIYEFIVFKYDSGFVPLWQQRSLTLCNDGVIKFSTSDNAFRLLWLVHSILVISSYTLVWPYLVNDCTKRC